MNEKEKMIEDSIIAKTFSLSATTHTHNRPAMKHTKCIYIYTHIYIISQIQKKSTMLKAAYTYCAYTCLYMCRQRYLYRQATCALCVHYVHFHTPHNVHVM